MIFVSLKFEFNLDFSKCLIFEKVFKTFIYFNITMINAILYFRQVQKLNHVINVIIIKNINEIFNSKKKVDSTTILFLSLQKF